MPDYAIWFVRSNDVHWKLERAWSRIYGQNQPVSHSPCPARPLPKSYALFISRQYAKIEKTRRWFRNLSRFFFCFWLRKLQTDLGFARAYQVRYVCSTSQIKIWCNAQQISACRNLCEIIVSCIDNCCLSYSYRTYILPLFRLLFLHLLQLLDLLGLLELLLCRLI